ncbi:hypothetical protein ACIRJR_27070 [Streptomyces sp. NPDC102402]|uniref:hypothetical protein n=1 Tax=Streptomyces sp. NPDC102402 TaxID=3366169 RepID=UPI003827E55B
MLGSRALAPHLGALPSVGMAPPTDHYAHVMPGAEMRGVAATDAWLAQNQRPKCP